MTIDTLEAPAALDETKRLSEAIYTLLRRHIENRIFPDGLVLGEAGIAKALDVSRTPARAALQQLASEWLIAKFRGRGHLVSYTGRPVAPIRMDLFEAGLELSEDDRDAFGLSGASDRVYPQIEATISSCVAFGSFAIDRFTLADTHNLSPTLTHVILTRLEQAGLTRQDKQARWYADKLTPDQVAEYYELRQLLEPVALKSAYAVLDMGRVIEQRDWLKALMVRGVATPSELNKLERDLHVDIVGRCTNAQLARVIKDSQRSLIATSHTEERYGARPKMNLAFAEHLAVLEALIDRNVDAAAEALRVHLDRASEATVLRIASLPPLDADRYPAYLMPVDD